MDKRKILLTFAKASESAARRDAMLRLARSEPPIPILPDALDQNDWLLNCSNGTLDLETGQLRPHRREDFITKLCPVEYDPDAKCPQWREFLKRIFAEEASLLNFVRNLAGYCLTGNVSEQLFAILYGTGANGKSTLTDLLLDLLGDDYSMKATADMLMMKRGEAHPTALADFHGKRLVVATETEDGRRLAESLVKELTGGDKIRAQAQCAKISGNSGLHIK